MVMIPIPGYCSLFSSSERFKDLSKVTQPVRGRASTPAEPRVLTIHRTAVLPQDALGLPRALTEFLTSGSELTPPQVRIAGPVIEMKKPEFREVAWPHDM